MVAHNNEASKDDGIGGKYREEKRMGERVRGEGGRGGRAMETIASLREQS